VLVSVYMWNQAPFATLLLLAGMQSIPTELYMAAEVDGAGYWQRLRYVTLPAPTRDSLPCPRGVHGERVFDARPDLHPDDGRPGPEFERTERPSGTPATEIVVVSLPGPPIVRM